MFTRKEKTDERAEYRALQTESANASPNLAQKYEQLKGLTLELSQYETGGERRASQLKQSVNLEHASSLVRVHCGNMDCVRGDFDLSNEIATAVAAHRPMIAGELVCQGWLNKAAMGKVRCARVLRFKIHLQYT
jgi:hypothetical protein